MDLQWACSCKTFLSLDWTAQQRKQNSRCGFSSAKQHRRITSLNLLVTFSLMKPRRPSMSAEHIVGSYSVWCQAGSPVPFQTSCWGKPAAKPRLIPGVIPPQVQRCICKSWTRWGSCQPISPVIPQNCPTPVWCMAALLCVMCDLPEGAHFAILDWPQYQCLGTSQCLAFKLTSCCWLQLTEPGHLSGFKSTSHAFI